MVDLKWTLLSNVIIIRVIVFESITIFTNITWESPNLRLPFTWWTLFLKFFIQQLEFVIPPAPASPTLLCYQTTNKPLVDHY